MANVDVNTIAKNIEIGIVNMNIEKTRLSAKLTAEIRDFPEALYNKYKNMLNIYAYDLATFHEVVDKVIREKLVVGANLSQINSKIYGNILSSQEFDIGEKGIRDLICTKDNIDNHTGRLGDVWEAVKQDNNVRPTTSTWKCKRTSRQVTDDIEKIMTDNDQVEDLIKCKLSNVDPNKCTCLKQIYQNMLIENSINSFQDTKNKENIVNSFLENYYNIEQKGFTDTQILVKNIAIAYLNKIRGGVQKRAIDSQCDWVETNECGCNDAWGFLECLFPDCSNRLKICKTLTPKSIIDPMLSTWIASFTAPKRGDLFNFTYKPPLYDDLKCCINTCNSVGDPNCLKQSCTQYINTSINNANTIPNSSPYQSSIPESPVTPVPPIHHVTSVTPIRSVTPVTPIRPVTAYNSFSPSQMQRPTTPGTIQPQPVNHSTPWLLIGIVAGIILIIIIIVLAIILAKRNQI